MPTYAPSRSLQNRTRAEQLDKQLTQEQQPTRQNIAPRDLQPGGSEAIRSKQKSEAKGTNLRQDTGRTANECDGGGVSEYSGRTRRTGSGETRPVEREGDGD